MNGSLTMATPKNKSPQNQPPTVTAQQRRIFLIITLLLPVLLVFLLEIGLRVFGYGSEFDLVTKTTVNGKEYYRINPNVGKRYFDPARYFVPQIYSGNFEMVKSPNTLRIFVVGESTPAGFPYQYNATPSRILQKQLEILHPEKNIEVVNAGLTGTNSYTVLEFVDELTAYQPDAFIVYSGQNEFYGAFGTASTNSIGGGRWMIRLYQSLRNVKTFVLLENSLTSVSRLFASANPAAYNGTLMQQLAKDKAIPFNSASYRQALESFGKNITETIGIASSKNVPIIISTLVTNEGSLPPFVSLNGAEVSEQQKQELTSLQKEGEDLLQRKDLRAAAIKFRRITEIDPTWAMGQFRLGQCYHMLGQNDSAFIAFGRARDYDGLRFRASGEANSILRTTAAAGNAVIADVESDFRAASPDSIIGASLLWEHVHPTFSGYVLLAKCWLNALESAPAHRLTPQGELRRSIPDSLLVGRMKVTALDLEIGSVTMRGLLNRWPFTEGAVPEMVPQNDVQQIAQIFVKGKIRWNEAHYRMADLYRQKGDADNALNEYEAVAAFYPADPYPVLKIGDILSEVGAYEQSSQAYLRSLTLQENSVVRMKLGIIYLRNSFFTEAVDQLTRATSGGRNSAVALTSDQYQETQFYLAAAMFRSGNPAGAKTLLKEILRMNPNDSRAQRLSDEINSSK
ncbi:MAG: tetratricopeptide repeat protein [Bacteroidota bacterium]